MSTDNRFPVLYGRRITNTAEFREGNIAAMSDLLAGRISVKEANAINREARQILKMFQAVVTCGGLARRSRSKI